METEELLEFLSLALSYEENINLNLFSKLLIQFKEENQRLPLLPIDLNGLLNDSSELDGEDFEYLLDNCAKFVFLESQINNDLIRKNESIRNSQPILNEFKFSALLAAELQKIITRKYLPEVNLIKV